MVSQPKPETEKSPYFDIAKKFNVKIDFRPFIHVEGVEAKDFRKDKVNILDFTAVIFTSRNAVDHYFRICNEMRITVPDTMKYFCLSEAIAFYLQKYIIYRKRKIFFGKQKFTELMDVIKKHKTEKFLLPCSDIHKDDVPAILDSFKINYKKAIIYRTVASDMTDLGDIRTKYDLVIFFSPTGIKSLFSNFPNFDQADMQIGAFGPTTSNAVSEAGLRLDLQAPMPQAPSMTMALEMHLKLVNKK